MFMYSCCALKLHPRLLSLFVFARQTNRCEGCSMGTIVPIRFIMQTGVHCEYNAA